MNNSNKIKTSEFIEKIGAQSARKLKSQKNPDSAWFGLGMMGLIGWSVIVPTLTGAGMGSWLDKRHVGGHSWTLALMIAGLCIGCLNVWHWMSKQHQDMQAQQEDSDE